MKLNSAEIDQELFESTVDEVTEKTFKTFTEFREWLHTQIGYPKVKVTVDGITYQSTIEAMEAFDE